MSAGCPCDGCTRCAASTTRRRRWCSTASCTSARRTRCRRSTPPRGVRSGASREPRTPGLRGDAAIGFNRGVAVLGPRVFLVTDNAHLVAVSRVNGALLWEVVLPENTALPYGGTMAPLVVGDLVIAGVSGGDEGIRGFLAAYRADTGEQAWRFWTIPARGEPGSETWKGSVDLEKGGGATWLTGTYDPETDTLVLAHRQPVSRHRRERAAGRQPVHECRARARRENRSASLALSIHAVRLVGLGRGRAARARRCDVPGPPAQAAAPGATATGFSMCWIARMERSCSPAPS